MTLKKLGGDSSFDGYTKRRRGWVEKKPSIKRFFLNKKGGGRGDILKYVECAWL